MRCHDAAAALMEEQRTPELQAHLETCEECRSLAALHGSASRLRLPSPPALAPISRDAVQSEVRRRVIRRRAAAGAVASLAIAGLVLWTRPPAPVLEQGTAPEYAEELPTPRAELGLSGAPHEQTFPDEVPAHAVLVMGRGSLMNLMGEVRGYTRRDLVVQDETYRPFGTLAAWVRPPDSRALETPPFRTAVLPLYPQE
ncbi:hypothetical protein JY651_19770 [Pyxidicoccus parkwayensis]|uniref:Zinc-finger domain-containing protein n=1 Tax=Pyxidicoccus parkwayensis TaxID=2813578 RepID=A0ABX7P9A3_9BACT|nr:hypothetical protein [Pyxidicoccus parkwaysis]QSQ27013.1 hypothetical protein JY651_19770 [Pyxidicoccus parkwaysis]